MRRHYFVVSRGSEILSFRSLAKCQTTSYYFYILTNKGMNDFCHAKELLQMTPFITYRIPIKSYYNF